MNFLLEAETTISGITLIQISRKVESVREAMLIINELRSCDQYGESLKVKAVIYQLTKVKEVKENDNES